MHFSECKGQVYQKEKNLGKRRRKVAILYIIIINAKFECYKRALFILGICYRKLLLFSDYKSVEFVPVVYVGVDCKGKYFRIT